MKNKLIGFLVLALCWQNISTAGVNIYDSIMSGGQYRKFRLYIPSVYTATASAPLVLNLHGYTSNSQQQELYANFMPVADTAGFLLVSPDGTFSGNNQFWNAGFGPSPNDVMFINDLVDSLSFIYNIDQQRVYSCGMSNGGIMSYYMACNLPGRIAAIASVTGSMLNAWLTCAPPRPFPVMEIHGTADAVVQYTGDATFGHIDSVVKKWRVHNNCNPAPVTFSVPNINMSDNSTAVNYKYTGGSNGADVELYKVFSGSHSWPGAVPVIANTNQDFSATVEIWRFFRKYKLNNLTTTISENYRDEINVTVFPNPVASSIHLNGITNFSCKIISVEGAVLLEKENENSIDVSALPEGMYFIEIVSGSGQRQTLRFIKADLQ